MSGAYNRTVYHKEDLDRFLIALKKHNGNKTMAAREAGFKGGRRTVIQLMEKYKWFQERVEDIEQELIDEIEANVIKSGRKKSGADARFLLKYHKKGRERGYGERQEHSGRNGGPIEWSQVAGAQ